MLSATDTVRFLGGERVDDHQYDRGRVVAVIEKTEGDVQRRMVECKVRSQLASSW
jgi:hypothetical protein